ncbi:hypothetical protein QE400_000102 [Xanthomonas sacchari]|uniref:hypothetical protein n=1 Tax=Xanthomonas sacchari TaxID=56458 RepID=UPI002782A24D|nr:hypothetical protein [Xanthomonas sacchari]MDQ1090689.1 hypothetical protein [Xanthomonas sacchari]
MSDADRPSFDYTLISADGCKRTTSYAAPSGHYQEVRDTGWSPGEPELQTARAEIEIHWPLRRQETLHLDGDQHRDIEDYDLLQEVLDAIAAADEPGTVLEEVLSGASRHPMGG